MSSLVSNRLQQIPFSSIREIFEEAASMERDGMTITHMEIGRPDFDTPAHIKEASISALEKGNVHYTSNNGIPELRQAIAAKLARENGIQVDPDRGVVVTIGCKEAIVNAMLAFLNPGDEVLVPDPGWLEYRYIVRLAGGIPVSVPLREEHGFLLDPDDVKARISSKTKMLVLNSPHNPTGSVLPQSHLKALADLAISHELIVLSDEIYEKLIYEDAEHISIAALPGMIERTLTVNGFSKAYAMDGWRLGYVAGPPALIQPIMKVHQYNTTCATSFAQYGAVAAYQDSQEPVQEMVKQFDRRRRFLVESLQQIPGVTCVAPKGAFYVFPSFTGFDLTSKEIATRLLREAQIASVPGSAFGEYGEGHIRMAYSTEFEHIADAVERMSATLIRLRKSR